MYSLSRKQSRLTLSLSALAIGPACVSELHFIGIVAGAHRHLVSYPLHERVTYPLRGIGGLFSPTLDSIEGGIRSAIKEVRLMRSNTEVQIGNFDRRCDSERIVILASQFFSSSSFFFFF